MSAFNLSVFILCTVALIEGNKHKVAVILSVLYGASSFLMVFFTVLTTRKDPTDPTVALERAYAAGLPAGKDFNRLRYGLYCDLCDTHVLEGTKHCRICNRCTSGFDHHCAWVNNDIGKANYRSFISMLIFLLMVLFLQVATIGFCIGAGR